VQELDAKFINSKDFVAMLKSKLYCLLNTLIMRKTSLEKPPEKPLHYRFWVEPSGNNHALVKSVIKRRQWLLHSDMHYDPSGDGPIISQNTQLFWTQVRKGRFIKHIGKNQIYNHLDGIGEVAQKSSLFVNMHKYFKDKGLDPFKYMPETHLIPLEDDLE
jgi:hypothetical protein